MRVGPKRKGKLHFRLLWEAAQPTQSAEKNGLAQLHQ